MNMFRRVTYAAARSVVSRGGTERKDEGVNQTGETREGLRQRKEKNEIEIAEEGRSRRDFVFPVSFSSLLRRKSVLFLASLFFFPFSSRSLLLPLSLFLFHCYRTHICIYMHKLIPQNAFSQESVNFFQFFRNASGPAFLKLSQDLVERYIKM